MPQTNPIDQELRRRIGDDIAVGHGRNEIARRYRVSPGLVSKIAGERKLWFAKCTQTAPAVQARQIDAWAARIDREAELEAKLDQLARPYNHDGTPTRQHKKLTYALYNLNRHNNGRYR